jgi:DNA-binding transcriptional ArsR family regulator
MTISFVCGRLWSVATHGKSRRTVSQDAHSAAGDPAGTAALDALGDRSRRAILERLRHGPLPVGALADGMTVGRPAVSQHLKVLKDAGLVVDRRQGTRRLYELDPRGLEALRRYATDLWSSALGRFGDAVDDLTAADSRDRA